MPRRFDGKKYLKTDGAHKKTKAKEKAKKLRKNGRLARVVPSPKSMQRQKSKYNWLIYTRRKD